MKVGRHYLGKMVRVVWHDPCLTEAEEEDRRLGRRSLARQVEYGMVSDITDGVVEITHTETFKWPDSKQPEKRTRTTVQEEIISSIDVAEFRNNEAEPPAQAG